MRAHIRQTARAWRSSSSGPSESERPCSGRVRSATLARGHGLSPLPRKQGGVRQRMDACPLCIRIPIIPGGLPITILPGRARALDMYARLVHVCRDSSGVERLTVDQEARVQFPFPVPKSFGWVEFPIFKTAERLQP